MACKTCGHTMEKCGETTDSGPVFWCPRCGTIKHCWRSNGAGVEWLVPRGIALVLDLPHTTHETEEQDAAHR